MKLKYTPKLDLSVVASGADPEPEPEPEEGKLVNVELDLELDKALATELDYTQLIGRHGCTPNYSPSSGGSSYAPRHTAEAAANSRPVGEGVLKVHGGLARKFKVLCVAYKDSWRRSPDSEPRYVISPEDAGWVIREVAPYMRDGMKPVFARASRQVPFGSKQVRAPEWADWIHTRWICPSCIPKMTHDYYPSGHPQAGSSPGPGVRKWVNGECSPGCDVSSDPNGALRTRFGYDNRVMVPWVKDFGAEAGKSCAPLTDQPGSGLKEPPVCLPVPLDDLRQCRDSSFTTAKYWEDFWAEVGAAIQRYNADAEGKGFDFEYNPTMTLVDVEEKKPPWLAIFAGVAVAGSAAIFAYRRWG